MGCSEVDSSIEQHERNAEPITVPRFDDAARARRLEQRLHDGPALRLAALSLRLGLCRHRVSQDERGLHECISGAQDELHEVLQELREVAGQIYPPVLATGGLGAALEAMAERNGLPVTVRAPDDRYDAAVETAAYFAAAEHLLSLPEDSPPLTVCVRRAGDELVLTTTTDSSSGPVEPSARSDAGRVAPAPGEESVIRVRIPCE